MKVLITGGTGFLGSHLMDRFLERGDEVYIIDTGSDFKIRHAIDNPNLHYIHESIFNTVILDSLIMKVDLIYHMAAVVGVEHYVEDPYKVLNVNVNGTQRVLEAAFKYGKKVVFTSTSEVYGRNPDIPFKEDDDRVLGSTRIDRWCYSTSKACGEHFCFAFQKMGLPVVVLRYFNAYGPRLDKLDVGRVITIFLGQIIRKEPITVVGDGMQTRCFSYVSDATDATFNAGIKDEAVGNIINIGNDKEYTILHLAETMKKVCNVDNKIEFVPQEKIYGTSYEDVPRRVPNITLQKEILGVTPKVSLEDGLTKTVQWFYENLK
ncbi:MAG: NAD-dependent epimerase/dehydratase family protein [Candidatus Ancaeobacter aquaticus]|nr:NAD-dependent epimerase/dehydratase family protein [Candidatus Ancaeobacter aquaticus]